MAILEATPLAPPAPLRVDVIADSATAERLRSEWHDLLGRSAANANGLALTPEWLLTWWREFGDLGGRELRLTTFRRGDTLVGLAPMLRRRVWYPPGVPFRRLEFLATGEPQADAICSDYLNVVAQRGAEAEVAAALCRSIQRNELGSWDEVVLSMMDGDDAMPGLLTEALQGVQRTLDDAPYITLPATWDGYLQSLTKKSRWNVKNSLVTFDEWAGATGRLERTRIPADLDAAKQTLIRLHRERWGTGGTFRSPRFLRFHDTIMQWLLPKGDVELLTLFAHGEPIAAQYNLAWDDKVYFYQCGRKTDVPHNIRAGVVLLTMAIRAAIESGRREFDFLNGASMYKTQLARQTRPLVEIRAVRETWPERLRRIAEHGRRPFRAAKGVLRRALEWLRSE